jgi:hypothetical protein
LGPARNRANEGDEGQLIGVRPRALPLRRYDNNPRNRCIALRLAAPESKETLETHVPKGFGDNDVNTLIKQYKVLTQKDRFFAGKFDPVKLEAALNSYAAEGWQVISVATAEIPGFGNKREELIVVMERSQ